MRKVSAVLVSVVVLTLSLFTAPAAFAAPPASSGPTMAAQISLRWCTWGTSGRCYERSDAVVPAGVAVNAVC